ncbi:MAG: DEAD/DEAH box helicase [Spirochaetaceae bacterium]|jgi:superfamily II DNA/RNA helicase|nr:DEAD/DEAH box helicase [Spirochaetaceae bacterium]
MCCFIEGIDTTWTAALAKRRINEPTAIQRLVIPRILARENVFFRSATGTGKTFAYMLPLLQHLAAEQTLFTPQVIILAPTIELAAQIKHEFDFLTAGQKLKAHLLAGGANIVRQRRELKTEKHPIIIATPKRVLQLVEERKLNLTHLCYLVLDEADRFIARDHIDITRDFLRCLREECRIIACSATLSVQIYDKLRELTGAQGAFIETGEQEILRNAIEHLAVWSEGRQKRSALRSLIAALHAQRILVFASASTDVRVITADLQYHKIKARSLSGSETKQDRMRALDSFRRGQVHVLVSSDLAARGIDIPDITHVVCTDVPESADVYIHRAGRTARCGKRGTCISVGDEWELRRLAALEKKLKIIIYPKVLFSGRLYAPGELGYPEADPAVSHEPV